MARHAAEDELKLRTYAKSALHSVPTLTEECAPDDAVEPEHKSRSGRAGSSKALGAIAALGRLQIDIAQAEAQVAVRKLATCASRHKNTASSTCTVFGSAA